MIKNTIVLEVLSKGLKEGITRIGDLAKANKSLADAVSKYAVKSAKEHNIALKDNAVIGSKVVAVFKELGGQKGHFEKRINYLKAENGEYLKQYQIIQRIGNEEGKRVQKRDAKGRFKSGFEPEKIDIVKIGPIQTTTEGSIFAKKPTQKPQPSPFGGIDIGKLVTRAAVTIPVWAALRAGINAVTDIIPTAISRFKELDDAVINMQIMTTGIDNVDEFRKKAFDTLNKFSKETGIDVATQGQVASTISGLGVGSEDSLEAMQYITRAANSLGGDANLVASAVVTTVKSMGKAITVGTTDLEKMIAVTTLLHRGAKRSGGSINDLATALKSASLQAGASGMSVEQLLANLTALYTSARAGGMGGTAVNASLEQLIPKRQVISDLLSGITPEQEKDQFKLLTDTLLAIDEFASSGDVRYANKKMEEIFGSRAGKNVKALTVNVDTYNNALRELKSLVSVGQEQGAKSMFGAVQPDIETYEKGLSTQEKRFSNIKADLQSQFMGGVLGVPADDLVAQLDKLNDSLAKLSGTVKGLGTAINLLFKAGGGIVGLIGRGLGWVGQDMQKTGRKSVAARSRSFGRVGGIRRTPIVYHSNLYDQGVNRMPFSNALARSDSALVKRELSEYKAQDSKLSFDEWLKKKYQDDTYFKAWMSGVLSTFERKPTVDLPNLAITAQTANLKPLEDKDELGATAQPVNLTTPEQRKHNFQVYLLQQEALKRLGVSAITLKERELALLKEVYTDEELISKERQLQLEIIRLQNEEAKKYSDSTQSAIKSSLLGNLQGQGNSLFVDLRDNFTSQIQESLASGLSNILMSTGMGEMFSMIPGFIDEGAKRFTDPIVTGCDLGGKKIFEWIDQAFSKQTGEARGITEATASYRGTGTGLPGIWGSSIFSKHTMMEPPDEGFIGPMPAKVEPNFWGKLGAYGTAGLTSATVVSGGIQQMGSGGSKNIMGGLGQAAMGIGSGASSIFSLMGGSAAASAAGAGSMISMLGTLGVVGMVAGVGLMIASMFKKSKDETQVQTRTSEIKVGSKIDVSNKKLELINRNLIALNNTMQTFALNTSAYFAERSGSIDQEFALAGRRSY